MQLFGGVECGGTKFDCVLASGPETVIDALRVPTTTPVETLGAVAEFFARARPQGRLVALGVACFGPVDLDPASPSYGCITTTPKPHWAGADVVGTLHRALGVPIGWDTDVNGAALGEYRHGAGRGADPMVYVTVGTGIGGGAVVRGETLHGLSHPEMGHTPIAREEGDRFAGSCPFHGDCWEGMASGPALRARTQRAAETLAPDDPVWALEARYLARGLLTISSVLAPRRIVLGGGVMATEGLMARVRREFLALNHGYLAHPALAHDIERYLVAPGLGTRSGTVGALELARSADAQARGRGTAPPQGVG